MKKIKISDPSLRDGSHAVSHQLTSEQIISYLTKADQSGIAYFEVGHGNGLGASSHQVGKSLISDREMLKAARKAITRGKLSVHVIPGFATIERDLKTAIDLGVNAFRIGTHCTEIDTAQRHIQFLANKGIEAYGVLMMSHMADHSALFDALKKLESYGASGLILMDSAGAYLPQQVRERVSSLVKQTNLEIGFHAHNNLGLAVANSIAAVEAGATIIDATSRGFGAGAGNCQLEALIAVLQKLGYETGVDFYKVLETAEVAERDLVISLPFSKSMSILTAVHGVFSGFAKQISHISEIYQVDSKDVVALLGKKQVIAGQEDQILKVALELSKDKKYVVS